jgi:hypothetical protein
MVELELGSSPRARALFQEAVELDVGHANAWYQLGRLAEAGSVPLAIGYYHNALAAEPSHHGAAQRLELLDGSPSQSARANAPGPPGPAVRAGQGAREGALDAGLRTPMAEYESGPLGIEQMLRADQSDISRQAVAVIDSLRLTARLHFSAQLQKLTRRLVLIVGSAAVTAYVLFHATPFQIGGSTVHFYQADVRDVTLGAVAVWLMTAAISFLRCVTSVVTIANARMRIERGILHRWVETVDLWIVNDIDLDRDLIQRLTGDGTVTFKGTRHDRPRRWSRAKGSQPLKVTGLARGPELDRIYRQLLDLKFLLRANPIVKGIIQ